MAENGHTTPAAQARPPAYRPDRRISGAVMVDGEMIAFDANDHELEAGAQAVVIALGVIRVATIAPDHPDEMARRARVRAALIEQGPTATFGTDRFPLHVHVLSRFIPLRPAQSRPKAERVRDRLRAIAGLPFVTREARA